MNQAGIQGERVTLREVRPEDAPLLFRWKSDPLVREMALGRVAELTQEGEEEGIRAALGSDGEEFLVISISREERPIGYVRINWIDDEHRFVWLRFALGERRGEGFARDALETYVRHLFADGVHRVDAEAYEFNERSIALLAGIGFVIEGRKREAHFDGERYRDVVVLGLVRSDLGAG